MASTVARRSIRMHLACCIGAIPCRGQPQRASTFSETTRILPSSSRLCRIIPMSTSSCSAAIRENRVTARSEKMEQEGKQEVKQSGGNRGGERFRLTGSCVLVLQRGDLTEWCIDGEADAIVNAANKMMLGGGGVDGAIHAAAGKELLEACRSIPEVSKRVRCPVGSAVITPGFRLPVSKIIHTVGPMYDIDQDPATLLANAYKNSVRLATENGLKYIAFPAISCGAFRYPTEEAAKISIQSLRESAGQLLEVHFVLFETATYRAWLDEAEEKLEKLTDS